MFYSFPKYLPEKKELEDSALFKQKVLREKYSSKHRKARQKAFIARQMKKRNKKRGK